MNNNLLKIYYNPLIMKCIKIAYLLTGQARFFKSGYNSFIKELNTKYNVDVYIHTWLADDNIFETAPWSGLGSICITEKDVYEYINLYKPVRCLVTPKLSDQYIDKQLKRNIYTNSHHTRSKYNMFSQFYSLKKCYELISDIDKYDFIITSRCDLELFNVPDLTKLDINKTYFSNYHNEAYGLLAQNMMIVSKKHISCYAYLVDNIDVLYDYGIMFNTEQMTFGLFSYNNFLNDCVFVNIMDKILRS